MKISELISKLTVIQNNFGDVDVLTLRKNEGGQMVAMDVEDLKVNDDGTYEATQMAFVVKDAL